MTSLPRPLLVFVVAAGAAALVITWMGSITMGIVAGLGVLIVGLLVIRWAVGHARSGGPDDPSRRRLLAWVGIGGLAWVVAGTAIGRLLGTRGRPDATAIQAAAASDLGAEYMELVARTYHPERAGELQLLLAPYNSANYSNESLTLVPNDPRTSHASIWMYLERIPVVVYAPGIVAPSDSEERVTLADLAPTTAAMIGYDEWPADREGRALPGLNANGRTPRIVVTFVIDGGGWNALQAFPDDWPVLRRLMNEGANYRNAIQGSFPAVTACAHATIGTGTFPRHHGITGHNIRTPEEVRKTYGVAGEARPDDILVPTLADLWHDATGAWVGQLGYQVWHLGMLGRGGSDRAAGDVPVGVFWNEDNGGGWAPHHPERYRLPGGAPGLDVYEARKAGFENPGWDADLAPQGRQAPCCEPPVVEYQGDLIDAAFANEPIGEGATSLLYINYKAPDYAGHIYGMASEWEGLMLRSVDQQLGRLVDELESRFPGEYAVIVTADHGQCPLPDSAGGVRLDPIQLERVIEEEFGPGVAKAVEYVAPAEIWLHEDQLWDSGAEADDIAAFLRHLTYRQNLGPYVPASAVEQELLDKEEFAAVFGPAFLRSIGDTAGYGETAYPEADPGIPSL